MLLHHARHIGVRFLLVVGFLALVLSPAGAVPAQAATSLGVSADLRWVDGCGSGDDINIAVYPVFEAGVGEQRYRMLVQSSCSICPADVLLAAGAFVPANDLSGAELNTICADNPVHITWVGVGVPLPLANTSFVGLRRDATIVGLENPNVFAGLYEGLNL